MRPVLAILTLLAVQLTACSDHADTPIADPPPSPPAHAVTVARPAASPRIVTDRVDSLGRPVTAGCPTCHSLGDLGDPERRASRGAPPTQLFHQGLTVSHADIACRSCHQAPNYETLRLADNTPLPYTEVQTLCRQCHGPQGRDFDRGLHGGMNGHWDLSRGPRTRHMCTTCHDPHAPSFVGMHPARGPVDPRFIKGH